VLVDTTRALMSFPNISKTAAKLTFELDKNLMVHLA
jgi:hypothetical protein